MPDDPRSGISRRSLLKALAAVELGALLPGSAFALSAGPTEGWQAGVVAYLETLRRPDGGYAWDDQPTAHLTPTFAAIGAYRLLGLDPPGKAGLAEYVRAHHPFQIKKLEREMHAFEYQQIQALLWLGADAPGFREIVRGWTEPFHYTENYERHGNPIFQYEAMAFVCRDLLGLPLDDLAPSFVAYLDDRRRPDGSFNGTPASDGSPGQVRNTWYGLQSLHALGRLDERKSETIAWLRACQTPGGGFTHRPGAEVGGVADSGYTWAALLGLELLGGTPADPDACARQIASLRNPDGGFGARPGWASNAVATYQALDAIRTLGDRTADPLRSAPRPSRKPGLPEGLNAYTIQIESHGKGSPADAVELARALKIHLWGAKNAEAAWIARAQEVADRRGVPVTFFVANEEYGTWVDVPGLGTYSHTSDIFAPAGGAIGPSLANKGVVTWEEFRERRLEPLQAGGGRVFWQFGENEELVRLILDDSLERGGYAAISTFHFGNPDFTNSEPFLNLYRGRIPYIALQDAHGNEPWWFADMTTGFRTVFLAREPTWAAWLEALKLDRVAAFRRDAVSGQELWSHAGSTEVLNALRDREADWRWWDNPEIARPLASVVALTPSDPFEAGRPDRGIALRVRSAWSNTTQGQPKSPIAELVRLTLDGEQVMPTLVSPRRPNGSVEDHYHRLDVPDPARGRHVAEAVVRELATGAESIHGVEFHV